MTTRFILLILAIVGVSGCAAGRHHRETQADVQNEISGERAGYRQGFSMGFADGWSGRSRSDVGWGQPEKGIAIAEGYDDGLRAGRKERLAYENKQVDAVASCASNHTAQSDLYFLPCPTNASVSFEGETQFGHRIQRIEVRRMAYVPPAVSKGQTMMGNCVIYYPGDDYDPQILHVLDECIDPFVRMVSTNVVEIYCLAGAHSHFRQRWLLLGGTPKLESEEAIEWSDDPRNQPH